jgi:hypothetical protein
MEGGSGAVRGAAGGWSYTPSLTRWASLTLRAPEASGNGKAFNQSHQFHDSYLFWRSSDIYIRTGVSLPPQVKPMELALSPQ